MSNNHDDVYWLFFLPISIGIGVFLIQLFMRHFLKEFNMSNNHDDDVYWQFFLPIGIGIGVFLILLFMHHFLGVPLEDPKMEKERKEMEAVWKEDKL